MSNSVREATLPLRVVLHRTGESTRSQYEATCTLMDSPEAAYKLWQEVVCNDPIHEPDKEHLISVLLNTRLRPIGYHVVSVGSLNEAIAHPREIFRAAIVAGAYAFLLMHNHPSGDPTPSSADHRLTRQVKESSDIIGINFLDHVVVGSPKLDQAPYYSFKASGLL